MIPYSNGDMFSFTFFFETYHVCGSKSMSTCHISSGNPVVGPMYSYVYVMFGIVCTEAVPNTELMSQA